MSNVGAGELEGPTIGMCSLERDHRDDQSGEPEPDHCRQQSENSEEAEENDRRCERDGSVRGSFREPPARNPLA